MGLCDVEPDFMEYLSKECPAKMLLAEGAKLYRGTPGPINELYDEKVFKGRFKRILESKDLKDLPLQLAINGKDDRYAGFYQCEFCARYYLDKKSILRHLRVCIIPEKRHKNMKYNNPRDPE